MEIKLKEFMESPYAKNCGLYIYKADDNYQIFKWKEYKNWYVKKIEGGKQIKFIAITKNHWNYNEKPYGEYFKEKRFKENLEDMAEMEKESYKKSEKENEKKDAEKIRERLKSMFTKEEREKLNNIDHPAHYNHGEFETIDKIKMLLSHDEYIGFLKGNAIKYKDCADYKGHKEEDLKKADWYLEKLKEETE